MDHQECKFEDKVIEMHGDIKTLCAEFKAMNGSLRDTKHRFDLHSEESNCYRKQTTTIWTTLIVLKWTILAIFGTGFITQFIKWCMTR